MEFSNNDELRTQPAERIKDIRYFGTTMFYAPFVTVHAIYELCSFAPSTSLRAGPFRA